MSPELGGLNGAGLLDLTAELMAVPSVSGEEKALADLVEKRLGELGSSIEVVRVEDNVVARTTGGAARRLLLAGHLDTVPPSANPAPRLEGETLWGVGSADMKGGLAVMLDVLASVATSPQPPPVELTVVLYACEEVARERSGLLVLADRRPELLHADCAVVCEPTAAVVEAGCQGVVKARLFLKGKRAHTARPWAGRNAIHRLAVVLDAIESWAVREPVIDGCKYRETFQAVRVEGGVAANVVPDSVILDLNHRFAPDRDVESAFQSIVDHLAPVMEEEDVLELTDSAPAAPPSLTDELLGQLASVAVLPPRAKLGWTDVAFFAERGVPAVNFGPGDAMLAHGPDERVEQADLEAVRAAIGSLLGV